MNSKFFSQELFLLSLATLFAVPVLILAENTEVTGADEVMEVELVKPPFLSEGEASASADGGSGKDFCQKFESGASKMDQKIAGIESKLAEKRAQTANKIGQMQAERDQKLSEERADWDAKKNKIYGNLEAKAATEEQKQALTVFKEEVDRAVSERRASVDEALAEFRSGLSQTLESRKTQVDNLVLQYKKDVAASFEKSRAACKGGSGKKTSRQDLISELKSIKDKFLLDRQGIMTTEFEAQNLALARRSAVDMAAENFKMALELAKEKLKAAFPGQDI